MTAFSEYAGRLAAVNARQSYWAISHARGNDPAGDGSEGNPIATIGEFERRTRGLTPNLTAIATTIALASNGQALPQSTINVAAVPANAPQIGYVYVTTSAGVQLVAYAGFTPTSFLNCTGGTGTMTTGGAVATPKVIIAQIEDADPANPEPVDWGYAEIPSDHLLVMQGTPRVVPSTTTTINAIRAEAPTANPPLPRAVTINALDNTIYGGPSPYFIHDLVADTYAPISSRTFLEAAHVFTISAPYAPIPINAVRVVRPLNAVEMGNGHAVRIETFPVVLAARNRNNTHMAEDPQYNWNLANASYAGGDASRVLLRFLEIGGAPPTNDYATLPGATIRIMHSGAGQIWYSTCGVSSVYLVGTQSNWWGCRVDLVQGDGGQHEFYGGIFGGSVNIAGSANIVTGDVYIDQCVVTVRENGTWLFTNAGGTPLTHPIYDSAFYGQCFMQTGEGAAILCNGGTMHGQGNTIGFRQQGGSKAWSLGADRFAHLQCSTHCVSADGTLTAANAAATFAYGVNVSGVQPLLTSTGAGVLQVA